MLQVRLEPYEQEVLREITQWRKSEPGWMGRVVARANGGLRRATDWAFKAPGVAWTVDNVFAELLKVVNELAQDSVGQARILDEYRQRGFAVQSLDDVRALDLYVVDDTISGVDLRYRTVTAAQGVAAGFAGLAGLVPDIVGLIGLNLRAAGEYATYCGFDITTEAERIYALQILHSQVGPARQKEGLVPVNSVPAVVADHHTKTAVEQVALSASLKGLTRALAQRLTTFKLAQVVPAAGAIVGGGANALYTSKVCTAALNLYRERRLLDKYAPATLERYHDDV